MSDSSEITLLLQNLDAGDASVAERLTPLVYDELRRIAGAFMRQERADHTLQPTALVHEAYLRLVDQTRVEWRGRVHFLSIAARTMRRILIDHARGRDAVRRGGGAPLVTLSPDIAAPADVPAMDLLTLNDALDVLRSIDERAADVVELRFFGGLTNAEIAEAQGTSVATVKRDWDFARAWLRNALEDGDPAQATGPETSPSPGPEPSP